LFGKIRIPKLAREFFLFFLNVEKGSARGTDDLLFFLSSSLMEKMKQKRNMEALYFIF